MTAFNPITHPKCFIEDIGYSILQDPSEPGLWVWTDPLSNKSETCPSAEEALEGAWGHAVEQTLRIVDISEDAWAKMDGDAQRVAMTAVMTGDIPAFDDMSPDTQMQWVERVRDLYPDIGSKEAFRLAKNDYRENDGVIPVAHQAQPKHSTGPLLMPAPAPESFEYSLCKARMAIIQRGKAATEDNTQAAAPLSDARKAAQYDELTLRAQSLGYANLLSIVSTMERIDREAQKASHAPMEGLPKDLVDAIFGGPNIKPNISTVAPSTDYSVERPRGG